MTARFRAREDNLLEELADSMRAEVQNGSITALLFKVFTETELRELGLEDLANQAAQHERTFYADGASLKTEKKICKPEQYPRPFLWPRITVKNKSRIILEMALIYRLSAAVQDVESPSWLPNM